MIPSKELAPKRAQEISIPGVKNIFKKDLSFLLRVGWTLAITVCIGFSIYQIADAISRYLSYPVHVNVDVSRQRYVFLPTITFCPGELVNYLYNKNYTKKWPPTSQDWLNETQEFHLRHYNICAEIQFLIRDKPIYPMNYLFMYSRGPLKKGFKYEYEITETEFKSKSFPNKPCEVDAGAFALCWDRIVIKQFSKIAKCRLPFISSGHQNLTVCKDFETLKEEYYKVAKLFDSLWKLNDTKCLELCNEVQYHLTELPRINMMKYNKDEPENIEFHIDLSDNIKQTVTKDFGYTVPQLLSDIGGSLGLFLGCSVLSVLEILQSVGFQLQRVTPF